MRARVCARQVRIGGDGLRVPMAGSPAAEFCRHGGQEAISRLRPLRRAAGAAVVLMLATLAVAQELPVSPELERMVADGMVEALEARFGASNTEAELRLLALAHANQALGIGDGPTRRMEFGRFEQRVQRWLEKVDRTPDSERERRGLNRARARLEAAQWIATRAVAHELDEFTSSDGRAGDRDYLLTWLTQARALLDEADAALGPVLDALERDRRAVEERLLVMGAFESLEQLRVALPMERAWAYLRLGLALPADADEREPLLRSAETQFQALHSARLGPDAAARWGLGLALTFAAVDRPTQATSQFEFALSKAQDVALAARIRFEWLRAETRRGRYDLARKLADPFRHLDPARLPEDLESARFWISLAQLWDAIALLSEARDLRAASRSDSDRFELAGRTREIGMARITRLARRGPEWAALVELFLPDFVDADTPIDRQSSAELLLSARRLAEQGDTARGRNLLEEASRRSGVDPELRGEILTELGLRLHRDGDLRAAAARFEQLTDELPQHALAGDAAENAVRTWLQITQQSRAAGDAGRLVLALRRLLAQHPQSELSDEAGWWLPLALQSSGDLAAAGEAFAAIPPASAHWEEAQYQQLVCRRLMLERGSADSEPATVAREQEQLAGAFLAYAAEAIKRADTPDPAALVARRMAGRAVLDAVELYSTPGVDRDEKALELLASFEKDFPESTELPRAQSLRMTLLGRQGSTGGVAAELLRLLRETDDQASSATLARLTQSTIQELDAIERGERPADARELAAAALPLAQRLLERLERDAAASAAQRDAVSAAIANIAYHAGEFSRSTAVCEGLLKSAPRNGPVLRLLALNRTAELGTGADAGRIDVARQAWAALLRDANLRAARPQRYWEARWHLLELTLRGGDADAVRKALAAERAISPDFGGPPWQEKFAELTRRAGVPSSQP